MGIFIIIIVLAVTGAYIFMDSYNRLFAQRNRYKQAYIQVHVQLQRRYDLMPKLVETAQGYLADESETCAAVMSAWEMAREASRRAPIIPGDATIMQNLSLADGVLNSAVARLIARTESAIDLKADSTMSRLSKGLTASENRVGFARQAFNDAVMLYNNHRKAFPSNLIASQFGFASAECLDKVTPELRIKPKVRVDREMWIAPMAAFLN
jgi:LemA protein